MKTCFVPFVPFVLFCGYSCVGPPTSHILRVQNEEEEHFSKIENARGQFY